MTKNENAHARWTAMSSLKYAVANPDTKEGLASSMNTYLSLLNDSDLNVKRAALLSLNSIIHHQSSLIQNALESIMTVLYECTQIVLVRIIDLGPFKHKVDDGLPLRKAAFSCMDSILDELRPSIDLKLFIPIVCGGLQDPDTDVKMLNHQLISKLCRITPSEIMGSLAQILPVLDKAVTKKVKTAEVGTEAERRNDGKKKKKHEKIEKENELFGYYLSFFFVFEHLQGIFFICCLTCFHLVFVSFFFFFSCFFLFLVSLSFLFGFSLYLFF